MSSSAAPPPATPPGALLADEANQRWPADQGPAIQNRQQSNETSSSTFQRRRQHTIAAFLRQGESNENFKEPAPSIFNTYWNEQKQQQHQQQEQQQSKQGSTNATAPSASASSSSSSRPSTLRRLLSSLFSRRRRRGKRDDDNGEGESSSSSEEEEEEEEVKQNSNQPNSLGEAELSALPLRELEEEEDYEASNFATVDWRKQDETDMLGYHALHEPLAPPQLSSGGRGCWGVFWSKIVSVFQILFRALEQGWRAGQGWVLCGLVGATTGLLASMIDMCVHWVIDFRVGICQDNIFLSNKNCCAATLGHSSPTLNPNDLQQVCPMWRNWDTIIHNWGLPVHNMDDYITNYIVYVLISGVLSIVSWWLVYTWARYAAGSGIPEIKTILGGAVIRRVLGGWTLLTKCVALVLSVSSGLSVGKEGPFVHIAACVANIWCKIFKRYRHNQAKTNEILSAACAAGVAVAFGAPIGGILYSLEEVSSFFPQKTMWRAFFCAIIASITVTYVDPYQDGRLVQFEIDYTNPWQWFEMFPFFVIGCIGGLFGAFFIWANLKISRARKASFLAKIPVVEVCLVAMLSSTIKFQSAYTRGNTTSLLEALFSDCSTTKDPLDMCNIAFSGNTLGSLLFATMVTLLLTTYTIGLPIPSGLLIPSLTIGAAMGRFIGTLVRYLQVTYPAWGWGTCEAGDLECITPGIYALVGGAAVLAGVTRMTIALVVIMFEVTGGITYLLPIMVSVITAKMVGDLFGTESIYEGAIETLEYPFLDVRHEIPPTLKVKDAMTSGSDLLVLPIHGHTIASLHAKVKTMAELNINGFPIVTTHEEMLVVGYITRHELKAGLRHAMRHGGSGGSGSVQPNTPCYFAMLNLRCPRIGSYVDLSGLLDPTPVQVSEHMALYRLHDLFCKMGLKYVIVVRFGKAVGFVTKKDIIDALKHLHHQQHAGHEDKKEAH